MVAGCLPRGASAHGFGRLYNLPVPFWLYAWAAAAALLLSFVLIGLLVAAPATQARPPALRDLSQSRFAALLRFTKPLLQAASVLLLLLCIVSGLSGNRDPFRNFNMTFFWVVFLLGISYLTALIGNFYASLNPWQVLAQGLPRVVTKGRLRYRAERWGDAPALLLYLGFIWFELFGHSRPYSLSMLLLGYTLLNLLAVWLIGSRAWFAHGEFFAVFLRLVGLMAPLGFKPGERSTLSLRWPLTGLLQERPAQLATVLFALAMLSTTAFDGLRATQWWVRLFWSDTTGLVTALAGVSPMQAVARLRGWYVAWETFWLIASPLVYFAAYFASLALAKRLTRSTRPLRELLLDFGYTLLPIALVYHLTHYATLLLTQGLKIVSLASDPFGRGWDLFGTAMLWKAPILPGMALVWHAQVALILVGHIASVWVAHRIALQVFGSRRQALFSQLPMLALMVLFTVAGLWIIAQPLTVERML